MPHLIAFMLEILLLGEHDCSRSNYMWRHTIILASPCAEHWLPGTQVQALVRKCFVPLS